MKRLLATAGLVLALGLGLANAQNITKSIQGAQDPRGPIGWDTSNAMYFPGHLNAFGQMTTNPSPASCGTGQETGVVTAGSTDAAGSITPQSTSCQIFFGSPFNAAPNCVLSSGTAADSQAVTETTTGMILTSVGSGHVYSYVCIGNK